MFSSSQLLDYDEGTKPNETEQTYTKSGVDSEGFSHILEKENMRMVQLLGNLCNDDFIQCTRVNSWQITNVDNQAPEKCPRINTDSG